MPPRAINGIEELKSLVGQTVGTSDWLEISQSRIDGFAEVTEDRQWIHIDTARAKTDSPFGTTIAHGFLTLSLISHLASQTVHVQGDFKMGINYGLNRLRFPAPVPSGSRVRASFVLNSVENIEGGIQITWGVTVEVEGAKKPSLAAEWLVRYYK